MQAGTLTHGQTRPGATPYALAGSPLLLSVPITLALATVLVLAFAWISPDEHEATTVLLNGLLLAICIFPGVRWYFGPRRVVPIFECICLAYGIHFGVATLVRPNEFVEHFTDAGTRIPFTESELATTLGAVIVGVLALQLAYALYSISPLPHRVPAVDVPLNRERLHRYLLVTTIGGLILVEVRGIGLTPGSDSPVGAILNLLANQLTVAVAILSYLVFSGRPQPRIYSRLLILSVLGSVWLGLTTAQFENLLIVPVVIAITTVQLRRQFMLLILGAVAVGYLLVIQPVKIEYRKLLVQSPVSLGVPERIGLWAEAFGNVVTPPDTTDAADTTADSTSGSNAGLDTVRSSLARVDYTHFFELVRLDTPAMIPYYNGSSYSYFFVGWIPRAIWPDKPSALDGNNRLVLDYGLLSVVSIQTTTAGLGLLPEAYANFGDLGMVLIMALQGFFLAMIFRAFTVTARIGPQAVLLSVAIFLINGVGGITAVMYSGLLQNLAGSAILLWLAAGNNDVPERLATYWRRWVGQ